MGATERQVERGCHKCPYSGDCPNNVKMHYGFTLVGPDSYLVCKAYKNVGCSKSASDVLAEMEEHLPKIEVALGPSD